MILATVLLDNCQAVLELFEDVEFFISKLNLRLHQKYIGLLHHPRVNILGERLVT